MASGKTDKNRDSADARAVQHEARMEEDSSKAVEHAAAAVSEEAHRLEDETRMWIKSGFGGASENPGENSSLKDNVAIDIMAQNMRQTMAQAGEILEQLSSELFEIEELARRAIIDDIENPNEGAGSATGQSGRRSAKS